MKTLVIHPNDPTTRFLSDIYEDKNWTFINTNTSKKYLIEQIKLHDRIVMLGHGSEHGLFGFNRLVIDSRVVYLLREKVCVCIWCNADVFVEKYGLFGFYTGMIISEYDEAIDNCVKTDSHWLNESNVDFAKAIKESIDSDDFLTKAKMLYEGNSVLVEFNRNNLYFKSKL